MLLNTECYDTIYSHQAFISQFLSVCGDAICVFVCWTVLEEDYETGFNYFQIQGVLYYVSYF